MYQQYKELEVLQLDYASMFSLWDIQNYPWNTSSAKRNENEN